MVMLDSMASSIFSVSQVTKCVSQFWVIVHRIEELLLKEDTASRIQANHPERVQCSRLVASWAPYSNESSSSTDCEKEPLLEEHAFTQRNELPHFVLSGIDFTLQEGKLLAVIGKVGSGKTSLLASIMGETHIKEGALTSRGSIAYVEQEPLILSDSVRNNILFGLAED